MSPNDDTRDRVIRLEAEVRHMAVTVDKMAAQLGELHALLHQARGAKWVLAGACVAIGAAGSLVTKFFGLVRW